MPMHFLTSLITHMKTGGDEFGERVDGRFRVGTDGFEFQSRTTFRGEHGHIENAFAVDSRLFETDQTSDEKVAARLTNRVEGRM